MNGETLIHHGADSMGEIEGTASGQWGRYHRRDGRYTLADLGQILKVKWKTVIDTEAELTGCDGRHCSEHSQITWARWKALQRTQSDYMGEMEGTATDLGADSGKHCRGSWARFLG